jgi:hypothetical protein
MECHLDRRSKLFSPRTSIFKSVKFLSCRFDIRMYERLNLWIQDGWKDRLMGALVIACVSDVVVEGINFSRLRVWIYGWVDTWVCVRVCE